MTENVWLRTYQATDGHRALDIEFTFIPIGKPVTLRGSEGKSYGGLNLRVAPRDNTIITVPTGPASQDLPDTPLALADLTSKLKDPNAKMPSGAAIFVDPHHPDFPPTWLTRHYGILCVGWKGVNGKDFEPGLPIRLAYRIWVHNGPSTRPRSSRPTTPTAKPFGRSGNSRGVKQVATYWPRAGGMPASRLHS